MKGGSLKDAQELLRHKTMIMTLRYAHLTQEHKRKAANLLNGLTASEKADGHKMVTNPFQENMPTCNLLIFLVGARGFEPPTP